MCSATKKKIIGGSSLKNSSFSLVDRLVMELNCDESCRFHGSCPRTLVTTDAARFMIERSRN
jgi:hypothetical protein